MLSVDVLRVVNHNLMTAIEMHKDRQLIDRIQSSN